MSKWKVLMSDPKLVEEVAYGEFKQAWRSAQNWLKSVAVKRFGALFDRPCIDAEELEKNLLKEVGKILEKAMDDAYELFRLATENPNVGLSPRCADELYLDFFVKLAILYLRRKGYNIRGVKTIRYGDDEYTVIRLDECVVEIRNVVSYGVRESFEFAVLPPRRGEVTRS